MPCSSAAYTAIGASPAREATPPSIHFALQKMQYLKNPTHHGRGYSKLATPSDLRSANTLRINLESLTSPCKRKRKSSKSTTSANKDTTAKTPAAIIESSADMDTEVGTPSAVDEPGAEVATEGEAVVALAVVDKPSNDAAAEDTSVGTPAVVDGHGTDATTGDTAVGTPLGHVKSVSSEVMTNSL
ncbi:uncharacterized protein PAC_16844 [Phialocephala subalpina]|uniref:Uncharacterized protein n=1 Tax=Phialocephala subalpina TaxID=576137 RepID=A0A1L7XPJ9_9HELO|nr:uncharacterized protein PAC_16844 [Phialocephala subalpina]